MTKRAGGNLAVILVDDGTDHPVVTIQVSRPEGLLLVMAEWAVEHGVLVARRLHVQGIGPNAIGPGRLRRLAERIMRELGYDRLIVEGALRTTGAGPGRRRQPVRIAVRLPADTDPGPFSPEDGDGDP
jgi:hypothetical protein